MESRLSTLATLWVRTEPHWRPQPAKLPSFGGYSLETLPINATGVIPAEMVILPLMTISAGMTPIVLLCFSPCYSPCYCAFLLAILLATVLFSLHSSLAAALVFLILQQLHQYSSNLQSGASTNTSELDVFPCQQRLAV